MADEHGFVAMGGGAEQIEAGLKERWHEGMHLSEALALAVDLLGTDPAGGPARELAPEQLEVAVLDRHRPRRTFRRITGTLLGRLLSSDDPTRDAPEGDEANGEGSVRDATTNPQTQRTEQDGPPA